MATLVDARELTIPAGQRSEALVTTVPAAAVAVEARLAGSDALRTDDRAFAIVPAAEATRALLVGEGSAFLESALALLPRLELYAVGEAGYEDAIAEAADDGTPYGLVIFDGIVPAEPPAAAALYLDPGEATARSARSAGRIDGPAIERPDPDEPLLRFVDLSSIHIGRAREVELAAGMRPIVVSTRGAPLIAVGEAGGRRVGVVAFDLDESDLPLQVAFPLLMSNLVDYLLPIGDGILPSSMRLGESITVGVSESVEALTVATTGASELPGATSEEIRGRGRRRAGHDSRCGPRRPARAARGQRRRRARRHAAGHHGRQPVQRRRVRLAPGDPTRIRDMGRVPDEPDAAAQSARSEWWWPIALVALLLLAVEWVLFHRPTRRTLARAFGRRPQPLGGRAR